MKERLTLPERAGVIHLLPGLDLLVLLLVILVLVTNVAQQAGIGISAPGSVFRLRGYGPRIAVTAKGDIHPSIFVGVKRVALDELGEELEARRNETGAELVVINADRNLPHGVVWRMQEEALARNFKVALGASEADDEPAAPGKAVPVPEPEKAEVVPEPDKAEVVPEP